MVSLYTVSCLYHSVPWRETWKHRMQRLDHSMIYVLIAGTYTPIAAIVLGGWLRPATLGVIWGITIVGVGQKLLLPRIPAARSRWHSRRPRAGLQSSCWCRSPTCSPGPRSRGRSPGVSSTPSG